MIAPRTLSTANPAGAQRIGRAVKFAVAAVAAVTLLNGCAVAQIKGLVMGGADTMMPTNLSNATTDVVLAGGFALQQKPVCKPIAENSQNFTCTGVTVDGKPVATQAQETAHSEADITITVAGKQLYQGTMAEIFTRQFEGSK